MTEALVNSYISVVRGQIDPDLARQQQTEMIGYLRPWMSKLLAKPAGDVSPRVFNVGLYLTDIATDPNFSATMQIADILGTPIVEGCIISVNYQLPCAAQKFHQDNFVVADTEALTVHGEDNGFFDYVLGTKGIYQAERMQIIGDLMAGDVVYNRSREIYHRGRNGGNQLRVTSTYARIIDPKRKAPGSQLVK